jgi:hypothetical protein
VLRDDEVERFVTALARAHRVAPDRGVEPRARVRPLLDSVPEPVCATYLAELRRRQDTGEPLVR